MIEIDKEMTVKCISVIISTIHSNTRTFLLFCVHPVNDRSYHSTNGDNEHIFGIDLVDRVISEGTGELVSQRILDDFSEIKKLLDSNEASYFRMIGEGRGIGA